MIHRSYHDSLTVRVDHLKTEELERVEKTIQLLDDFSNLFSIMSKLLQEAVFLGQQSTLCCNMLRLAFAHDDRLHKTQTPTLTKLFELYQGIDT